MKKQLLLSTAIVGGAMLLAGPAFAEVTVTVSGGYVFQVGWGDEDVVETRRDPDFSSDAEVHIKADGTSEETGLKYGVKLELFADQNTDSDGHDSNVDEAVMYLSGEWGRILLGDEDGAADNMIYHAASIAAGSGGVDGDTFEYYNTQGNAQVGPKFGDSGDSTKITYFTPRFSGIQVGVSYAPDTKSDGTDIGLENGTGVEDFVEVGINFVESFNGIDVAIAATGGFGDDADGAHEDTSSWSVGAKIGFSGITIAAGYADEGDSGDPTATHTDQTLWNVGVAYGVGPWSVSAGYLDSENGSEEFQHFALSATYSIAPGLNVQADLSFFESDDGTGTTNDGTVFLLGTGVSF